MFYFLSVLFIIKYRVYPSEQIKLFIYNKLQSEVCWVNSLCIKWCILINVNIDRCFFHLSVYANVWILKLNSWVFPSSHTLKANGLGTALTDGDVALHLTFYLRCELWLEDMSKGLHNGK